MKLFICCCDNRVNLYRITATKEDYLFVLRNIGNLIPPYEASESSVSTAIEYAVERLSQDQRNYCLWTLSFMKRLVIGKKSLKKSQSCLLEYEILHRQLQQ